MQFGKESYRKNFFSAFCARRNGCAFMAFQSQAAKQPAIETLFFYEGNTGVAPRPVWGIIPQTPASRRNAKFGRVRQTLTSNRLTAETKEAPYHEMTSWPVSVTNT